MICAHIRAAFAATLIVATARASDKPVWLVITTPQLAPSIQPLAERRRDEGLEAAVVTDDPATAIAAHKPAYVLLVGDAPGPEEEPDPAWHVPTVAMPLYRWREEQAHTFASDSKWGELTGDDLPDVAVGRIPARTPEEVERFVAKVIAFEDRPWTTDDLRAPMWCGAPNYGPAVDAVATNLSVNTLQTRVPRWAEPSLIAGDATSSFRGWPAEHAVTFDRWLRRGGLTAIMGGHGLEGLFFSMEFQGAWCAYRVEDVERDLGEGPPTCPVVIFSCSTGNFASSERCLTEALALASGGPVLVAGATTESHGIPNCLHGFALARGFAAPAARFGDLWLAGLRNSLAERNLVIETLLRDSEGSLEATLNVDRLRRDQIWMYAVLGDSATRVRLPEKLDAKLVRDGESWRWTVERPADATRLEVAFRELNRQPPALPRDADRDAATKLFAEANAIFAYEAPTTIAADKPWRGEAPAGREVRLIAFGPDRWYATVLTVPKP